MATIAELAAQGVSRMRQPGWALQDDYVRIDLVGDGMHGPWGHLYSKINMEINGRNPASHLLIGDDNGNWEPYEGAISPDDTGPR